MITTPNPDHKIDDLTKDFQKIVEAAAHKIIPTMAQKAVGDALDGLLADALQIAVDIWRQAPLHVQICAIRPGVDADGKGFDPIPARQTAGSSGYDLRYVPPVGIKAIDLRPQQSIMTPNFAVDAKGVIKLYPGSFVLLPTGIAVAIPQGFEAQVRPRSGMALKDYSVPNSPGTIDSDYRVAQREISGKTITEPAEIKVLLRYAGTTPAEIKPGDRIAQLVFVEIQTADFEHVEVEEWQHTAKGEAKSETVAPSNQQDGFSHSTGRFKDSPRTGGFGSTGSD